MDLLVSVRDVEEARMCLKAKIPIIDIKEPRNGPLGLASLDVLEAIGKEMGGGNKVSLALGEIVDLDVQQISRHLEAVQKHGTHIEFIKFGLSSTTDFESNFEEFWNATTSTLASQLSSDTNIIPVCYADHEQCSSISFKSFADKLASSMLPNIHWLMLDTWNKSSGALFDAIDPDVLQRQIEAIQKVGTRVAIAGRLSIGQLEAVFRTAADVAGFRSAVCKRDSNNTGSRIAAVCESRLNQLARYFETERTSNRLRNDTAYDEIKN